MNIPLINVSASPAAVSLQDARGTVHTLDVPVGVTLYVPEGSTLGGVSLGRGDSVVVQSLGVNVLQGVDLSEFVSHGAAFGFAFLLVLLSVHAVQLLKRPVIEQ